MGGSGGGGGNQRPPPKVTLVVVSTSRRSSCSTLHRPWGLSGLRITRRRQRRRRTSLRVLQLHPPHDYGRCPDWPPWPWRVAASSAGLHLNPRPALLSPSPSLPTAPRLRSPRPLHGLRAGPSQATLTSPDPTRRSPPKKKCRVGGGCPG